MMPSSVPPSDDRTGRNQPLPSRVAWALEQLNLPGEREMYDLVRMVARAFDVSAQSIIRSSRDDEVVRLARHVAMYVIRTRTRASFPRIGRLLGRDHTTVMSACKKIEVKTITDEKFAAVIQRLLTEAP